MRYGLIPTLEPHEREALQGWLRAVLASPRLVSNTPRYPLIAGKIGIYENGLARQISPGIWERTDGYHIYVGQENSGGGPGLLERLGIIAAIISAVGMWAEFTDTFSTALSRSLLESYNEMMGGLVAVRGGTPATGLAFSGDRRQAAARFGEDGYFLPNGEAVTVDESWVVVE